MSHRILVVDEDPQSRDYIGHIAASCGYETATAGTAGAFLQYLHIWQPAYIVLDLHMQEIDGKALLRHLWEAKSGAKVVIVGRVFDQGMIEIARRLGQAHGLTVTGVMFKPIHPAELRAMLERLRHDAEWLSEAAVERAILRDELFLEYQPALDLRSGRVESVEALLRWAHPKRGLVPPGAFIPFVEASHLTGRVTGWVLRRALRQLGEWARAGIEIGMSINLSAHDLRDRHLGDALDEACAAADVPAGSVTLELTETALVEDQANAVVVLGRLCRKGFRIAIDDFGTGYSSLAQLRRLPFSQIKIDRSLVADCHDSRQAAAIMRSAVELAQSLGLGSLAEGVETREEMEAVTGLGCDAAQGHFISRPLRAPALVSWLGRDCPVEGCAVDGFDQIEDAMIPPDRVPALRRARNA